MATLTRRVALGWARAGKLDRAEALAAADSSVEGWRCAANSSSFRVILPTAVELLRAAGPYAGTGSRPPRARRCWRCCSRSRTTRCPALGAAFLALERGDTTAAVAGFASLGAKRPRNKGGAELLLLAGRLEAARGPGARGGAALPGRGRTTAPATAPAALLELGRLLAQFGRGRRSGAGARAPDPGLSAERAGAPGAPRARRSERGGAPVMCLGCVSRRDFLRVAAAVPVMPVGRCALRAPVRAAGCWFPWTTRRPTTSRPTASRSARSSAACKAEWLLNYRGGSFLLPDDAATARDAALNGVTVEAVDDGAGDRRSAARSQATNMDAVPLEKAPKVAVYVPPNAAPWDDAVTMALQVRRHQVREDVGRRGAGRRAQDLRLAAPAPRGLHRPVLQVLPQLRRRALARRDGRAQPARWRGSSGYPERARAEEGAWPGRSRASWSGAASCSRCAPRPRRSTWRWPREDVDIAAALRRRHADGPRAPAPRCDWSQALAFQDAHAGAEPDGRRCSPTSTATR